MAALTGAILGAGAIGYGLFQQSEGREQAEQGYMLQQHGAQIQGQAARIRADISKEQAVKSGQFAGQNRDLEIEAAQQSVIASQRSVDINKSIIASERANEAQRMQAMELDARRKQLEIIRNQQRARAIGLTNATAQGARQGSGLQGGYGQISGQTGVNMLGVQQSLDIGRNMFANNMNISNQRVAMGDLELMYAQQRAAMTTARSQMAYDYAQVNAGLQTRQADADTMFSQGSGFVSQGGGQAALGNMQIQSGSQFISMGPQLFNMGMTLNNMTPNFGMFGASSPSAGMGYTLSGTSRFY